MLSAIINWITSPFEYAFMQHAFLAGTLAAILASAVGYFIVVRQLGFAAHALGHISFTGACGAMLLGWTPIAGQLILTTSAGIIMGFMGKRLEDKDTAIGITLALALGLGVFFLYLLNTYSGQANSVLFGNLLGVSADALQWMLALTLLGLTGLAIIARPLWFSSLMPILAEAKSLPTGKLVLIFFTIIAIAITLASQVVGVLLVFTLIVGPPAIALQWSRHFWPGIFLSISISIIVTWIAIYISYYTDLPISFCISALIFLIYLSSLFRTKYTFR